MEAENKNVTKQPCESYTTLLLKSIKFIFVLTCYTLMSYALLKFILWINQSRHLTDDAVGLVAWLGCDGCGPSGFEVCQSLVLNAALFGLFIVQHTLLAKRYLNESRFHRKIVEEWKIGKAIYTLTTGLVLLMITNYWNQVPVYIWKYQSYYTDQFLGPIHALMWINLYGAALIQDLPDLVGLDEAILVDNATQKSSRFMQMLREQRHTGLIPFAVLTIVTDLMTLDRAVFLALCTGYCFCMWKQNGTESYDYVSEMGRSKFHKLRNGRNEIEVRQKKL